MALKPPLNVTRIVCLSGLAQLQGFFDTLAASGPTQVVGWDIETTPVKDFFFRRCRTIQFGNVDQQYVIDLLAFATLDTPVGGCPSDVLYDSQGAYGARLDKYVNLSKVIETIKTVVCGRDVTKVGVQLSFEYMMFYWLFGLRTQGFFDCAIVEKCIQAGAHSMKDYSFFSMEEMMARYFRVQIEKQYQESFTLEAELSDEQIAYAALDVRFPLVLRRAQMLVVQGETVASLQASGNGAYKTLALLDPILLGDNLVKVAQVENDAIGAFQDMHVHGERLDRERWLARVVKSKLALANLIAYLDVTFVPLVGSKTEVISPEMILAGEVAWKKLNQPTDEEIVLKKSINLAKRLKQDCLGALQAQGEALVAARMTAKNELKTANAELKKRRTRIDRIAAKAQGDALINYTSDAQVMKVLNTMPTVLKSLGKHKTTLDSGETVWVQNLLTSMDDETLEKYDTPVIAAIRKLHGLGKDIGTYGDAWATEWKTKPCKEEGWLHPGDGRLHCTFNQYDAETGRSSSEKPNGQNLPADPEIRECFIADDPDEEEPGGYSIVTVDMAGAELRIIAEDADDAVWIGAFNRGEDVHAVGTELLYDEWPELQMPGCAYFKTHTEATVAVRPLATVGDLQRQKCKCPKHAELRNGNKATNFMLAYGGGPGALASAIKKPLAKAKELMTLHELKNPRIWAYLKSSGEKAVVSKKAFDLFGRRRLFPAPEWGRAKELAKERLEDILRFPDEVSEANKLAFEAKYNRKPNKAEAWDLSHRQPIGKEISRAFAGMFGGIGRQGKNHRVQGTNATIAKIAMGAGTCPAGKPYLWHTLKDYKAKLLKFVHDELVVQCPTRFATTVAELIGDAFRRAAAERMTRVTMEFDFNIGRCWSK